MPIENFAKRPCPGSTGWPKGDGRRCVTSRNPGSFEGDAPIFVTISGTFRFRRGEVQLQCAWRADRFQYGAQGRRKLLPHGRRTGHHLGEIRNYDGNKQQ